MIQIFDDILSADEVLNIESIVTDAFFPWYLGTAKSSTTDIDYMLKNGDTNTSESPQMVHSLVTINEGVVSQHKVLADMLSQRVMQRLGITGVIQRAKFNLLMRGIDDGKYHSPHVDCESPIL
jgi:hypothetical protein